MKVCALDIKPTTTVVSSSIHITFNDLSKVCSVVSHGKYINTNVNVSLYFSILNTSFYATSLDNKYEYVLSKHCVQYD